MRVREVKDYTGRVKEELLKIAEQVEAGDGFYSDRDIRIQIKHGAPEVKLG